MLYTYLDERERRLAQQVLREKGFEWREVVTDEVVLPLKSRRPKGKGWKFKASEPSPAAMSAPR